MKKVFAVFILLCFLICLLPIRQVKADSFPSEFFVNSEVYYSAEELFLAYTDLTFSQEEICNYLLGMYNLMYLGARGFSFKRGAYSNESAFIAKIKSFGFKLLQGAAEISLKSRMDADFCKYASACILYSSQCNVSDFDEWFDNLDDDFLLPVDQGILNSFTLFYNDNSNEAIADFGEFSSPWESGSTLAFGFGNMIIGGNNQNKFNQFVLDYSPVLFSHILNYWGRTGQLVIGNDSGNKFPDTLFILRGLTYNTYAYGYTEVINNSISYRRVNNNDYFHSFGYGMSYDYSELILVEDDTVRNYKMTLGSINDSTNDLSDTIEYIFNNDTPIPGYNANGLSSNFNGAYPCIYHVVLVDNISTLSNPEEVYNTDNWDVINDFSNMLVPVDPVSIKPKIISTLNLPDNINDDVPIQDIIDEDSTVDENGDPVNPWQITVIVQPNETNPISIDVNMFSSAKIYIQYLWDNATAFLGYCKDLLDCFAFTDVNGADYGPKYAIYGVIVLGVASGLIAKFLL